jgi:hypothetical protein
MTDPLQEMFSPAALAPERFPPTSRYHGVDVATIEDADGNRIVFLRRRFVPPADRFALIQLHSVTGGDRLDNLAARYLGDPERFWQLCDANGAIRPNELVEIIGRHLRITLPEGVPGAANE